MGRGPDPCSHTHARLNRAESARAEPTEGGQAAFGHLVDQFAQRNTVIVPELSGSEEAEDDGGELTVQGLAEEVSAVIADCGSGPVDLLGFSLGGSIVAAAAALHPEQVRSLIPIGGLVRADLYMQNLITLTLSQKHDPLAFGRVLTTTAFSPQYINSLDGQEAVDRLGAELSPSSGRIRQLELLVRVDLRDLVGKVQAPALVIASNPDAAVPTGTRGNCTPGSPAPSTASSIAATWCSSRSPRRS